MIITRWRCVNPDKFPCDASGGCGGAACWKARGFTEEPKRVIPPPLPQLLLSKRPVDE